MALSWRLAAVIRDDADQNLLSSYGPERTVHVQEIIGQAVEMGRIICMLDPDEVSARNASMKAALKDPDLALKPPPEPRLGEGGAYIANDPSAGYLSVQGRVRQAGREGLFDDIAGAGWQLLLRGGSPGPDLSKEARATIDRWGIVVGDFDTAGDTIDLDGAYGAWFHRLDAEAVLVRPDFYVFGTSTNENVGLLLDSVDSLLGGGKSFS